MCVCVCVGKPRETSVAIATHSMVWRGSRCEERIRKGRPPRGVRIPFSRLWIHIISFSLTYECEKWTDHTFSFFYSRCYDMTHRILCLPPCFRPITQSSVEMRLAPEIWEEVFKKTGVICVSSQYVNQVSHTHTLTKAHSHRHTLTQTHLNRHTLKHTHTDTHSHRHT